MGEPGDGVCPRRGGYTGRHTPERLFKAIWCRARKEVQQAAQLTFIGFSFHEYLRQPLRWLTSDPTTGRPRTIHVVNPDLYERELGERKRFLDEWMERFLAGPNNAKTDLRRMRKDFGEFIRKDLDYARVAT